MDPLSQLFSTYDGYYVALIIITIVTIAIGIALAFFFIFIPSIRIAREFNLVESRAEGTINDVTTLIDTTTALSKEVIEDLCQSIYFGLNRLFGTPRKPHIKGCVLDVLCVDDIIPTQC